MTSNDREESKIENLTKKLFSNEGESSASHDVHFKQHNLKVAHTFDEADVSPEEEKRLAVQRMQNKEREMMRQQTYSHNPQSYGHYSAAENSNATFVPTKAVNFGHEAPAQAPDRVALAKKKMEQTNLRVSVSNAEYKNAFGNKLEDINESIEERGADGFMHRDLNVYSVGDKDITNKKFNSDFVQEETEEKHSGGFGFVKIIFVLFFLFFVASGFYTYKNLEEGNNIVSTDKIQIAISAPVSVKAGYPTEFIIDITNYNNVELQTGEVLVEYPIGTKDVSEARVDVKSVRVPVGSVAPGETARVKHSAVFFGEENVTKTINHSLEYTIPESTSLFSKNKAVDIFLSGQPIAIVISNIKEVTSNQDLTFDVELTSNINDVLKNIQLKIEYPFGFRALEATTKPSQDNNTWNFKEIKPGDKIKFTLKGKLIGTNNLFKNFRFSVNSLSDDGKLGTVLASKDEKVTITAPFVLTSMDFNDDYSDVKAITYGESVLSRIVVYNNLAVPITDVVIDTKIIGDLLNRKKIRADAGFYRSTDDVVFWDKNTNSKLALIKPGDKVELALELFTTDATPSSVQNNRRVTTKLNVDVKAKRLNENNVSENITSGIQKELRLATNLSLKTEQILKNNTKLEVDKESVYEQQIKLGNTANLIKGMTLIAKLKPNVIWKNAVSDNINGKVYYNENSREISITVGELEAGTEKILKFEYGVVPSINQKGQDIITIEGLSVYGDDVFTGLRVTAGLEKISVGTLKYEEESTN